MNLQKISHSLSLQLATQIENSFEEIVGSFVYSRLKMGSMIDDVQIFRTSPDDYGLGSGHTVYEVMVGGVIMGIISYEIANKDNGIILNVSHLKK